MDYLNLLYFTLVDLSREIVSTLMFSIAFLKLSNGTYGRYFDFFPFEVVFGKSWSNGSISTLGKLSFTISLYFISEGILDRLTRWNISGCYKIIEGGTLVKFLESHYRYQFRWWLLSGPLGFVWNCSRWFASFRFESFLINSNSYTEMNLGTDGLKFIDRLFVSTDDLPDSNQLQTNSKILITLYIWFSTQID